MKPKVTTLYLRSEIYPFCCLFWFGPWDQKEVVARLEKETEIDCSWVTPPREASNASTLTDDGINIVWRESRPETPEHYASLMHELEHVVLSHGDYIGVMPVDHNNQEFYCYLIGWLSRQLFEALW